MAQEDRHVQRMQAPDPRMVSWKPAKTKAPKAHVSWTTAAAPSRGSSAQSVKAEGGKNVRIDAANEWGAEQQRNMELRGTTMFLLPMGGNSPIRPGRLEAGAGRGGNAFFVELAGDWAIDFDWTSFDRMGGSSRANAGMRVDRLCHMTVRVETKGFKVSFPADVLWHEGEAPDLVPTQETVPNGSGGTVTRAKSAIHVINFMCFRRGVGSSATNEIHGTLFSRNAAKPAAGA